MTKCVNYPYQPYPANYSGVTIQITNPTVNANPNGAIISSGCQDPQTCPMGYSLQYQVPQQGYTQNPQYITVPANYVNPQAGGINSPDAAAFSNTQYTAYTPAASAPVSALNTPSSAPVVNSYPPQYYMNNYTYNGVPQTVSNTDIGSANKDGQDKVPAAIKEETPQIEESSAKKAEINEGLNTVSKDDMDTSKEIINNIDTLSEEQKEIKKTSEEKKIVALTDEYIKSLENYLNNPNLDIRLMAAKEILTRLDEDKSRYDDAALNALLNKMVQDPDDIVRIAALSAFDSGLASGNNYTVELLTKIQQNPESNKDDVLQASEILLKMTSGTDVNYTPAQTSTVEIKTTKKGE